MRLIALLLLCCSMSSSVYGQLVNIESRRMQDDSTRFVFQGNVSGSYTNVNGRTVFQARPALSTQFKSNDLSHIFFLLGDYRLLRSGDQDIANSWLLHLRYNYRISSPLTLEAFVQSQHDEVLSIENRSLVGTGLRVKLVDVEGFSAYAGNAYMYERSTANFVDSTVYNHRSSSYLAVNGTIPGTQVTITNTFYYQPLYRDFGDYRILEQIRVTIDITEIVNLFGTFNYYYDSVTPEAKRQFSSTTTAGLGITL